MNGCKFQFTGPTGQYSGTMNVYISFAYADLATNKKGVFGIYDVATGNRVAASAQTVGLTNGWNTITLVGNFQLVNGAWYWLVMHTPSLFSVAIRTSAPGVGVAGQHMWIPTTTKTYDGTLPATLPTFAGTSARIASIYASLTTSGTSPPSTNQTAPADTNIAYSTSNVNLAIIPNDWGSYDLFGRVLYGGNPATNYNPQICFLDYSVVRTAGRPSIRLEPHVAGVDVNSAREVNCERYSVKPGDHIVAKCWMKIGSLAGYSGINPNDYTTWRGARIGIDFYGDIGYITGISGGGSYPQTNAGTMNNFVPWNTIGWTQRTLDFIVPNTVYAESNRAPHTPTSIIMWIQVLGTTDNANAWFADAELYINP